MACSNEIIYEISVDLFPYNYYIIFISLFNAGRVAETYTKLYEYN